MNIRTTALAALLALAAPTAAQADFWTDFFGSADEVKRVHFGVHVSGENGFSRGGSLSLTPTDEEVTFKSIGTFDQHFECDLRIIESCEYEASYAQLFKIIRKKNPENEKEVLYDIFYRAHTTVGKPTYVATYKWEELLEPTVLPLGKRHARRTKDLTIRFYEAGQ